MTQDHRFYHLSRTALPKALGELALKAVGQNRRLLVAVGDSGQLGPLDDGLWTFRQEAFLGHGRDGDPDPELTPVWLSADPKIWEDAPNKADTIILTYGAQLPSCSYGLICDLFDGTDETQTTAARQRWKEAAAAGRKTSYFQQTESGGWAEKTQ